MSTPTIDGNPELAVTPDPGQTHIVENQPQPLRDYNVFTSDLALQQWSGHFGAAQYFDELTGFGAKTGTSDFIQLGFDANDDKPTLRTHDHRGARIDEVTFHPAYHELMSTSKGNATHSSPWTNPGPGAHVNRTAKAIMISQTDVGHGCPMTMTFAITPTLNLQPELAEQWLPKIQNTIYDPRNIPPHLKDGLTAGMCVTEKQGGSDVQANSTVAVPVGAGGPGAEYLLTGHKWFVSGPMGDLFLVIAQTPEGLSCFLVPRSLPDGTKNPWQIQQLKPKMGNISNASSETELRGATGWLIGEPGRGLQVIMKAITFSRFDCTLSAAGLMRSATAEAIHHAQHRSAFGAKLVDQPLMTNVLADLALESEAGLALTMRIAAAFDRDTTEERAFVPLANALGKYWVCKRSVLQTGEALECVGGSGVMEASPLQRNYREAPVNAIWEGSGNVQALDLLRTFIKSPESYELLRSELELGRGHDDRYDAYVDALPALSSLPSDPVELQFGARKTIEQLSPALQPSLLLQGSASVVGEAFVGSRLTPQSSLMLGGLTDSGAARHIVERAGPQHS